MDPKETINLREKLVNWCEKTTFHAIPNIATNKHIFLKLMWMFCLLASVSYCCSVLTSSITDYYKYGVLTIFDVVQKSSATFPAVIVCPLTGATLFDPHDSIEQLDGSSEYERTYNYDRFLRETVLSCSFKDVNFIIIVI